MLEIANLVDFLRGIVLGLASDSKRLGAGEPARDENAMKNLARDRLAPRISQPASKRVR